MIQYHPDPEINEGVRRDRVAAEVFDVSIGYPVSMWTCPCGKSHSRGWLYTPGVYRCLWCGYVGTGGVIAPAPEGTP